MMLWMINSRQEKSQLLRAGFFRFGHTDNRIKRMHNMFERANPVKPRLIDNTEKADGAIIRLVNDSQKGGGY